MLFGMLAGVYAAPMPIPTPELTLTKEWVYSKMFEVPVHICFGEAYLPELRRPVP